MGKIFEEFDHLRYYKDQCVEYLVTQECENRSEKRGSDAVPAFLPEVTTSIFATLLFIKFALVGLLGLLVLFCCLLAANLC